MSMNVGDSADLIHGGDSGGLRTFWRSRTEFEKKLLVALNVMALVIIGMTVAVVILAVQNAEDHKTTGAVVTMVPSPSLKKSIFSTQMASSLPDPSAVEAELQTGSTPFLTSQTPAEGEVHRKDIPSIIPTASDSDSYFGSQTMALIFTALHEEEVKENYNAPVVLSPSKNTMDSSATTGAPKSPQKVEDVPSLPKSPSVDVPGTPKLYPTPAL